MRGIWVDKLRDTHRWLFLEHAGSLLRFLEAVVFVRIRVNILIESESGVLPWRELSDRWLLL
jgi:hypothetical protein